MTGQQLDWSIWGRCTLAGKVRLQTLRQAETFAERCRRRFGRVMQVYRCPQCGAYHLTKGRRKQEKRYYKEEKSWVTGER